MRDSAEPRAYTTSAPEDSRLGARSAPNDDHGCAAPQPCCSWVSLPWELLRRRRSSTPPRQRSPKRSRLKCLATS